MCQCGDEAHLTCQLRLIASTRAKSIYGVPAWVEAFCFPGSTTKVKAVKQSNVSEQNGTSIHIQDITVPVCELRIERRTASINGGEQIEFVCGASGGPEQGYVLGISGEDLSSMQSICNACPIPNALASPRACLNLVPARRFPGGKHSLPVITSSSRTPVVEPSEAADAYFACRWFYTLYGQEQPRDITLCLSCSYWFPRPPRELIPGYWPETQKMLRVVNGEESISRPFTGFTPASHQPSGNWWQRLLQKFHL